ncbi:MAG: hypothetical protein NTZ33_14690 [Bacteroidetes bacterium]|nr:hypothetical protein [Bacteroidota bacterium]
MNLSTNIKMLSPAMKNITGILVFFMLANNITLVGQVTGDYRSNTSSTANWNSASSWQRYNGTAWVAATTPPTSTNRVTIQVSDNIVMNANPGTCADLFITGNLNWTTGGRSLNVSGNLIISDGVLGGTAVGDLNVTGTFTVPAGTACDIQKDTINISGATNIFGTINFSSSSTAIQNFSGLVTVNSSGSWNNINNSQVNFKGGITNYGYFMAGTGVHNFISYAQALTGNLSIPNVTVTGITLTNNDTLTVSTALAGTGTIIQATDAILNLGGTSAITTLNATASGNTVNYYAAGNQTACKPTVYNNLTVSNSGIKTFATTPTVNDTLSMEGSATITVTSGVITYGANATLRYNTSTSRTSSAEEWITPFVASGGVIIDNTATITMDAAKVFNSTAPLTVNNGARLSMSTYALTLNGDFINNGGTASGTSGGVIITGTASTQNIGSFSTTGTVSMTKTSGKATFTGNISAASFNINGSGGTLNLGAASHTLSGGITLTSGTLNAASSTVTLATNWTNNGGAFTSSTSTFTFNGSAAQSIGGTTATTFNNLTISNASGVNLSINVTVNGILNLTNGIVTPGSYTLTIANSSGSAVSGGSTTSFINGALIRLLTSGETYNFPVGKATTYLPFGFTSVTGTNPFVKVEAFNGNAGGSASSPLISLSNTEYWYASIVSGTYSGGVVSLTRQTALNLFESIGRNTTTLNGAYSSLNGNVSGTSVINSDNTANLLGYFLFATKKSLTCGTISPVSYCQGSAINVPFTATGTFDAGNDFTAQLSDSSGSFASPTDIGTLTSQTSGTINATIPISQIPGTSYRIRVISSSPSMISNNNGTNITIKKSGIVNSVMPFSRCGPGSVTLNASASLGTINWYNSYTGGSLLGSGNNYTTPNISYNTTYYVEATYNGCPSSTRTAVTAYVVPLTSVTASGGGTYCPGDTITLTSSGSNIANQFWTGPNGFYSPYPNIVFNNATSAINGTYTITGSALSGINLVTNGDFESGNTGFTTSYVLAQHVYNGLWPEGTYDVMENPHDEHPNFARCGDNTSGNGKQMVVNGSTIAGVTVWSQTVNVMPGNHYQFSYWLQSVFNQHPAALQVYINSVAIGPINTALIDTCAWKQYYWNWNSDTNTKAVMSIIDQNTIAQGNDFSIDDITFQQVCDATSTATILVNDVTAGAIASAQTICSGSTPATLTSVTPGTGTGTISYEWQTNASGSFVKINGATAATYNPPALTSTTSYRRRTVALNGGTTCYSTFATAITITVTPLPNATISYATAPFFTSTATPQSVTLTGTTGGTYSAAPTGLTLNASSGAITPSTSTPGNYTVTYTIAAFGGCGVFTTNTNVSVFNDRINVSGSNAADGYYSSLTNTSGAFAAINASSQTGKNIIITILGSSTAETGLNSLNAGTWTSLNLYPVFSGLTISGSYAGPLINLNGADKVNIDGRVNKSGATDLIITNTSTSNTSNTSTIRFTGSAEKNTINYCTIKGAETNTSSGIIFFSTSASGNGNDSNIINNNNITGDAAGRPVNAIYSLGASGYENNGITISNNNIFNVFNYGIASNGINLSSFSSLWTILSNSFYETTNYIPTASVAYNSILINNTSGVGFNISDNFIGGSADSCGGNDWTKTNAFDNTYNAINLSVGTSTVSNIQNNKINNFAWSNSSAAAWTGINISNGNVNIGTTNANSIGSALSPITLTAGATAANFYGIYISSTGTIDCQNNVISSINTTNANTANATNIYGIIKTAVAGSTTISNNIIGSTSVANSIQASSQSTANAQSVYGINSSGTGTIIINNNTIANLNNSTTNANIATTGCINGITATAATISNNTVSDLTIANANASATNTASICGIVLNGTGINTVSGNTIYDLSNTYASFAGNVIALYFSGGTTMNAVSANLIHSLSVTGASSTTASIYGIKIATGVTTYANNIISLGGNTKTTLYGLYDAGAASQSCYLYHNTIYLSGTLASGSTNKSYALYSAAASNIRNYRNNIFSNARSTVSGTSQHYAISLTSNSSLTCNYNDYYVSGTAGVLGILSTDRSTLAAWQTATNQDVNSVNTNPLFSNAGSIIAIDYKIAANLVGVSGTGITTDYGGITRINPNMGAWEKLINKWKGTVSNNWNTSINWTENSVPAVDADIIFDNAPLNHCQLDQDRSVTNITNTQSTYRMVCNGKKLTIKGSLYFTNGAQIDASTTSSTIEFSGASAQSVPSGSFYNNEVYNLNINNANNIVLNGSLRLLNTIAANSGRLDAYTNSPTVIYAGISSQTLDSNRYLNERIYNLTIDNGSGVLLNANFTINNTLLINAQKLFTIPSTRQLTVSGTITNNSDTTGFILQSDFNGTASLIHNTNNVKATVQRYINGNAEAWHFLSSPVSNQAITGNWLPSGTYGNGTGYDLYAWNEPTSCWIYKLNTTSAINWNTIHPGNNFEVGRGYLYAFQANNPTKEFKGNLNNGSVTYAMTATSSDVTKKGFNFIGNPYPSSIDWQSTSGWTRSDLLNSGSGYDMWIYNKTANNYGVCNSASGSGTNGVSRYIAPMQGFFVKAANAGNLIMDNAARVHNGAGVWLKNTEKEPTIISIVVQSAIDNSSDESRIQFGYASNKEGAAKLFSPIVTAPSLFIPYGNELYSIKYLTDTIENPAIPIMFKSGQEGNYTITCNFDVTKFETFFLEDRRMHYIQNMKARNTYNFQSSPDDDASRFILHFGPDDNAYYDNELPARVFSDGNQLVIDLSLINGETEAFIYDATGRLLYQKTLNGATEHKITLDKNLKMLLVKLINKQGKVCKKIIY